MYNNIYQRITDQVIKNFQQAGSWKQLWDVPQPMSLIGHEYCGVNYLLLSTSGYSSPVWGTFNQVRQNGGFVKKGESSHLVVFWKRSIRKVIDPKTGLPNEETAYLLRYYNVFNTDQCQFDSIGQDKVRTLTKASINQQCNRVSSADQIIDGMIDAPNVMHGSFDTPCYLPALDQIRMPSLEYFHCSAAYYATLFHELVHSTGHKKRLNRFTPENFSDRATYSKEELVAELGSAFLSAIAGLDHDMGNTQAYIKSWLNVLRDNPSWITWAASRAQKACELICPLTITHQVEPLNA